MSLVPLEPREIRLRRRPWTILGVWAIKASFAWIVAAPIARALGGVGVDRFPQGDALLFAPGGGYLLETLRLGEGPLLSEAHHAIWIAVILGYLSLIPLAGLMVALAHRGRLTASEFVVRGIRQLPAFTYLAGLTWLTQAGVAFGGLLLVLLLQSVLSRELTVRGTDLWMLAAAGAILVAVLAVGVVEDLARAALVRCEQRVSEAVWSALKTLGRRPRAVLLGYATPAVWSLGIVVSTMLAVQQIAVDRSGRWRLLAVLVLHQSVILALVALRSSWLARALALVPSSARGSA